MEKKKFLLEIYNVGLTYPQAQELENLTPADIITIKSILVLTVPELLFSRLSLPTTKILTKTELDKKHLLYWQIFNKKVFSDREIWKYKNILVDNCYTMVQCSLW